MLQHLEQLLGLGLGWGISAYPLTMNVTLNKKKVGFSHFVTFGTTFRVRVRVEHFSIPPNHEHHT